MKQGKLELGLSIGELARRLEASGVIELEPVSTAVWLASLALDWEHKDPADRVIVATAQTLGHPVLSKDNALRTFAGVTCVW